MDNGVAAVSTADCNGTLEMMHRFIYIYATNDEVLYAKNRRLDPVKYRGRASKACIAAVEAEEKNGHWDM
jgi:hypothetical protein